MATAALPSGVASEVGATASLHQGQMTEQELLHHTLLRDAAADHLAAGKFPLVFKGICAGSLPADFGANVPVAATAGTPLRAPAPAFVPAPAAKALRAAAPAFVPAGVAKVTAPAGKQALGGLIPAAAAMQPPEPLLLGAAGPGMPSAALFGPPAPGPAPYHPLSAAVLPMGGRAQEQAHMCRLLIEAKMRHKADCACSLGAPCWATHDQHNFPAPVPFPFSGNMVPHFVHFWV